MDPFDRAIRMVRTLENQNVISMGDIIQINYDGRLIIKVYEFSDEKLQDFEKVLRKEFIEMECGVTREPDKWVCYKLIPKK